MSTIFTAVNPTNPTIKGLLELRKQPYGSLKNTEQEHKWCEKAIKGLVRRIKKRGTLGDLLKAIRDQDPNTHCVTIDRSLDGRLQVCERKGLPHVIYVRLWRYPELQSQHQLRAVAHCRFAFNLRREEVCVNPYHYDKIEPPSLPPIMVPRHRPMAPDQQPRTTGGLSTLLSAWNGSVSTNGSRDASSASVTSFPLPSRSENFGSPENDFTSDYSPLFPQTMDSPNRQSISEDTSDYMDHQPTAIAAVASPDQLPCNESNTLTTLEAYPVQYCEPPFWCSVSYYELSQRVGEPFYASQPSIVVDGFCDPSNAERFCLGLLSNVNRNGAVVDARKYIGRGARLYYIGGEVYVECLSDHPIFVQSINYNLHSNWNPATVCKLEPGNNMKVFNNTEFARLLSQTVSENYDRVDALKELCAIRISFIKGWGAQYRRPTVTATPCWIEVHLYGPLQWLDRVLTQMDPPAGFVSSRT